MSRKSKSAPGEFCFDSSISLRLQVSAQQEEEILFLGALAVAAGLIYLGYEIGDKGDQLNQTLKETNERLKQLATAIEDVNQTVKQIVELLKKLPEEIRGAIEENTVKQAMALADSSGATLHDYMLSHDYFAAHVDDVVARLQIVSDGIYNCLKYEGVSGIFHAAPLIMLWTQAHTNLQRFYIENQKPWINPYQTQIHLDTVDALTSLMKKFDDYRPLATVQWRNFPHTSEDKTYAFKYPRGFSPTDIPLQSSYPGNQDRGNLFQLSLGAPSIFSTLIFPKSKDWMWWPAGDTVNGNSFFPDPQQVALANQWFASRIDVYQSLNAFFANDKELLDAKPKLEENVFTIPDSWKVPSDRRRRSSKVRGNSVEP